MFRIAYLLPLLAPLHLASSAPIVETEGETLRYFTIDANGTRHKFDPRMEAPPPTCQTFYNLIGDGSPTQWYYNKQKTNTVSNCQGITCSTTEADGETWTWGISLSLSPVPAGVTPASLAGSGGSVGFDWSESYTSTQSEGCSTDHADNVCLWYSQAYTGSQVEQRWTGTCDGGLPAPSQITLMAPNNDNAGGQGYYCVVNTCRNMGDNYWQQGAAGGPP